jgi:hypothetical protein
VSSTCNELAVYSGSDTNTIVGGASEQWCLDLCRSSYLHRRTGNTASQRQVSPLCGSRSYQLCCNRKQGESIVFACGVGSHYAHPGASQERNRGFSGDRICIVDTNNFFFHAKHPFLLCFNTEMMAFTQTPSRYTTVFTKQKKTVEDFL